MNDAHIQWITCRALQASVGVLWDQRFETECNAVQRRSYAFADVPNGEIKVEIKSRGHLPRGGWSRKPVRTRINIELF